MPYADPDKQRAANRRAQRRRRARLKAAALAAAQGLTPKSHPVRPPQGTPVPRAHDPGKDTQKPLPQQLARWLEGLTVTEGPRSGLRFEVLPWERLFLSGAFSPGVSTGALTVARGNGKTALVAGLAAGAVHPEGPLHRLRGQCVIVAGSLAQASQAFEHVAWFLRGLGCDLTNRKEWRYWSNQNTKKVEHVATGAHVVCRGADSKLLHGLAPSLILADEPAAWKRAQSRSIYNALQTALGKIGGARLVALGTRPASEEHWFERLTADPGPGEYALRFAAPEDSDPFKVATWHQANPSMGCRGFEVLAEQVRREARAAKRDPALRPSFAAFRLNMGTHDTFEDLVLDLKTYRDRCESQVLPPPDGDYFLGVDLGGNKSMTAAAAYWPSTGRLEVFGAWPEAPSLRERGAAQAVGDLYVRMAREGNLLLIGQHSVSAGALLSEALERWGRPAMVAGDHWRIDDLREALHRLGLSALPFLSVRNNYQDGGRYLREFRRAVRESEVTTPPSLLLRSALAEARTTSYDGMERLSSASSGGRRQASRDDALQAAILAVGAGAREHRARGGPPPPRSTRQDPEARPRVVMVTDSGETVWSDGTVTGREGREGAS